jgi:hypothetical protein
VPGLLDESLGGGVVQGNEPSTARRTHTRLVFARIVAADELNVRKGIDVGNIGVWDVVPKISWNLVIQ